MRKLSVLFLIFIAVLVFACAAQAITVYVNTASIDARPNSQLTPDQKAAVKTAMMNTIKENLEQAFGVGNVTVTNTPADQATADRTVNTANTVGRDPGSTTCHWGDYTRSTGQIIVHVGSYMDDPPGPPAGEAALKNQDGSWDTTKLGKAMGTTASHEVGHSYNADHDDTKEGDPPQTIVNKMNTANSATQLGGGLIFLPPAIKTIRANSVPPPSEPGPVKSTCIKVVWWADPTALEGYKLHESFSITTTFAFAGSLTSSFDFGFLEADTDGGRIDGNPSADFVYKSDMDGSYQDAPGITFFNGGTVHFVLRGRSETPYAGHLFEVMPNDVLLSDWVVQPDGNSVARQIDLSWDVDGNPGADVTITLDAFGPGSDPFSGFVQGELITPTMTAPTGTTGRKPMVAWTTPSPLCYTKVWVKITTDAAGLQPAWDSGAVNSQSNSLPVGAALANGTYYAFANVGDALGNWSEWGGPQYFTVGGSDVVQIRHMNEAGLLTSPTEFGTNPLPLEFLETGAGVIAGTCGYDALRVKQDVISQDARVLRKHPLPTVDLNAGVTAVLCLRVYGQSGTATPSGEPWKWSNIVIGDSHGSTAAEKSAVAIRTEEEELAICVDNATWTVAGPAPWSASDAYHIVRITGRNQADGDYTKALWNIYVDENSTPALTATGSMPGTTPSLDWIEDSISIGQTNKALKGTWEYDWIAVNMSCDYTPSEWTPNIPLSAAYGSIAAAKDGGDTRNVTITGQAVVTRVIKNNTGQQIGFYAQDVLQLEEQTIASVGGVKVLLAYPVDDGCPWCSPPVPATYAPGDKLTSIAGKLEQRAPGYVISNATVVESGTDSAIPVALVGAVVGGSCVDALFPSHLDNTCRLVRIVGRVAYSEYTAHPAPLGSWIFYVDDGSGAYDGRAGEEAYKGVRCFLDFNTQYLPSPPAFAQGSYLIVEGISAYEWNGTANVRTILLPVMATLAEP